MTILSSITIPDSYLQADGTRRVRYEFTTHQSEIITHGPLRVRNYVTTPPDNSETHILYSEQAADVLFWSEGAWQIHRTYTIEPRILRFLAEREQLTALESLKSGVDVFAIAAEHQTDAELYTYLINTITQLDIVQLVDYHLSIPILSALSNPFITGLGYNWQNWLDWRAPANTLKVSVDNYAPLVI